jgi:hypothetical protein
MISEGRKGRFHSRAGGPNRQEKAKAGDDHGEAGDHKYTRSIGISAFFEDHPPNMSKTLSGRSRFK